MKRLVIGTFVVGIVVVAIGLFWRAQTDQDASRAGIVALTLVIYGDSKKDDLIAVLDTFSTSCGWRSFPQLPRILSEYRNLRGAAYRPTYSKEKLLATTGTAKEILCSSGQELIDKFATAMADPLVIGSRTGTPEAGQPSPRKLLTAPPSPYQRGLAALNEGNFDAAITEFTAAIANDPKDTFSYIRRGAAYEKKGDAASAISDYRIVLKLVDADTGADYAAKIRKLEKAKK
jgi:tetratricopeptide (TPR) repeat protein